MATNHLFLKASAQGMVAKTAKLQQIKRQDSDSAICDDLTGWPQGEAVAISIYQVDSKGVPDENSITDWVAEVNNNTLIGMELTGGSNRDYDTLNTVVSINFTAEWANRLVTALLKTLKQDGTLKNNVVDSKHIKSVDGDKITVNSIDGDKISQKTINAKHLADDLLKISWKDVTDYQNGFGPYKSSGNYREPQYSKDAFGIVRLRGLAANPRGDVTDKAIFVLPADFRPQQTEIFTTPNAGTIGRINVLPNGEVHLSSAYSPNSTFVSLNGISFSTD